MKSNIIAEFNNIVLSHKSLSFTQNENDFRQFINDLYF